MAGLTFIGDSNANTAVSGDVAGTNGLPVGTAEGDLLFIPTAFKPASGTLATPSGWNTTTVRTVGTGSDGDGIGQIKIVLFWQVVPASPTVPGLAPTGTGAVRTAGFVTFRPDAGWTVEITDSVGSDTSSDTTFAVTGGTVLPYATDDWAMIVHAVTQNITDFSLEGPWSPAPTGSTFNNNLDSKWRSGGNSGNNLRSETLTSQCHGGPATGTPSFSTTIAAATTGGAVFYRLHPVHLPWHLLGIDGTAGGNHFKLQAALDGAGAVYEQTRAQLVAGYYEDDNIFPVGDDQEWCRFRVRIDGPTTGGTDYARSELREMQTNGTSEAAWSTASNTHRMKATIRVPSLSVFTKPTIIFGQIHDGSDDLLQVCTELNATSGLVEGKLRINGSSSGRPKLSLDWRELEEHTYLIDITGGVTRVYWDDLNNPIHITSDISSATAYFKVGCYPNTNETTDDPTDVAMVDVKDMRVWHTGYSGDQATPGGGAPCDQLFLAA